MEIIKVVNSPNSQTVHLPEAFCLPGEEVRVYREGPRVVLEPVLTSWHDILKALDKSLEDEQKLKAGVRR